MTMPILDRLVPKDWVHVSKYRLLVPQAVPQAEVLLDIPRQYRDEYDQGTEGACVGYSQSWMMSILNRTLYDAYRLYATAQGIDEWPETPPMAGTSLRAGFDVLRTIGHWRVYGGKTRAPQLVEGISENRWILTVDEARTALVNGTPLNLGCYWHQQFSAPISRARYGDKPTSRRREYWISPEPATWGPIMGGHAITAVGASDKRQAFALLNTWGESYPFLVWLPYDAFTHLMTSEGECGLITDRP